MLASFWFDMLKGFIVINSTVKPKETAPMSRRVNVSVCVAKRARHRLVGAGQEIALSNTSRYDFHGLQILLRGFVGGLRLKGLKPELPESPGVDIPNKFIVVRSTVKPKEKSPEEKSKD